MLNISEIDDNKIYFLNEETHGELLRIISFFNNLSAVPPLVLTRATDMRARLDLEEDGTPAPAFGGWQFTVKETSTSGEYTIIPGYLHTEERSPIKILFDGKDPETETFTIEGTKHIVVTYQHDGQTLYQPVGQIVDTIPEEVSRRVKLNPATLIDYAGEQGIVRGSFFESSVLHYETGLAVWHIATISDGVISQRRQGHLTFTSEPQPW